MKKILGNLVIILGMVFGGLFVSTPALAAGCTGSSDANCNKICSSSDLDEAQKQAAGCTMSGDKKDQLPFRINSIIELAAAAVGIISVLVIVIGGVRYVISAGDPGKVKQAKDMILYAIVALVVAGLAWAIVSFVSSNINSDANTGGSPAPTTT
ncbi:hypothetical protein IJ768_02800 [Candidatus Saccharibacteria bacterium]|nr:hypothetical protein [Candidatus Saccharibacteria bacterium]